MTLNKIKEYCEKTGKTFVFKRYGNECIIWRFE